MRRFARFILTAFCLPALCLVMADQVHAKSRRRSLTATAKVFATANTTSDASLSGSSSPTPKKLKYLEIVPVYESRSEAVIPRVEKIEEPVAQPTETFHQPARGRLEISLAPMVQVFALRNESGGGDTVSRSLVTAFDAGFSDTFALGFQSDYGTDRSFGTETTNNGWSDLNFNLRALHAVNSDNRLWFKLAGSISPDKSRRARAGTAATAPTDGNRMSGGASWGPSIGLVTALKRRWLVTSEMHYLKREQRIEALSDGSLEGTYTGGNIFGISAGFEKAFGHNLAGAKIMHSWIEQAMVNSSDVTTDTVPNTNLIGAEAFGLFEINSRLSIKPAGRYETLTSRETRGRAYSQFDFTTLLVSARITL